MERNNSEISFSKEPIATMDKDIVGWVKAIAGQWKSAEQTILDNQPEDNDNRQKHKEIGQDNLVPCMSMICGAGDSHRILISPTSLPTEDTH
jgi:hypothetical protein